MKLANRAFTLIELLVVIAIIAVLASVLFATFEDARKVARDDARKSALKEIQLAVELYKSQYGRYPAAGCGRGTNWAGFGPAYGNCPSYITGHAAGINFTPDFIAELPIDRNGETLNQGYLYRTDASGTWYKLVANESVESKTVSSYDNEFARCPYNCSTAACGTAPQADTYAVYSLGAECE